LAVGSVNGGPKRPMLPSAKHGMKLKNASTARDLHTKDA
jgi:hypothetical protein